MIKTPDGKFYHITGVKVSFHGNHVIIGDGKESVILLYRSRTFTGFRATAIGLGLVTSISALLGTLWSSPAPDVGKRIEQLKEIERSLRDLGTYVSEQRSTLQSLSGDIEKLQKEKESLSQAAQINRLQVQALLEYQAAYQRKREWLSVGLSFIIGVLSSLVATLLIRFLRRQTPTMEDINEGVA